MAARSMDLSLSREHVSRKHRLGRQGSAVRHAIACECLLCLGLARLVRCSPASMSWWLAAALACWLLCYGWSRRVGSTLCSCVPQAILKWVLDVGQS